MTYEYAISFVLVHGLTGDYVNTWTVKPGWRRKGGYCWPQDLLPELYPNLRIMSFSYDADVTHVCGAARVAEGDVVEYANTLLTWLRTLRPDDSPEVRFVATARCDLKLV